MKKMPTFQENKFQDTFQDEFWEIKYISMNHTLTSIATTILRERRYIIEL